MSIPSGWKQELDSIIMLNMAASSTVPITAMQAAYAHYV